MNPLIQLKKTTSSFVIALLVAFRLVPLAHAVVPAPDGGYPGGNTAEGQNALLSLTSGQHNTAVGFLSLRTNTTNSFNTALGSGTLLANTADANTATGAFALLSNTTGANNTANGAVALFSNTTGGSNNAFGARALYHNVGGFNNVAVGNGALFNTTGASNTALGISAGALATTGIGNVYIGASMHGEAGESNHTYIRNINTTTVSGAGAGTVTVDLETGLLGHATSSRRYKEDIQPMDKASETLFALKPVTFRYKKEIDESQSLDYGLIAEDVAKIDPKLAVRDRKGQIESVRYTAINAMLLNEFLKAHRTVQEQKATIAQLKSTDAKQEAIVAQQQKQLEALTVKLEKVSAQLEISKSAPQTVLNIH